MFSWPNEKRTDSLGNGSDTVGVSAGYQLVAAQAFTDDSPSGFPSPTESLADPDLDGRLALSALPTTVENPGHKCSLHLAGQGTPGRATNTKRVK